MPQKYSWRQNLKDLTALTEISISSGDPEELYAQLTERIAKITRARGCLIAIYDSRLKCFVLQQPHYGVRPKAGIPLIYEVTAEKHHLWSFKTKGTLVSNAAAGDPRVDPLFVKSFGVKSAILAPMMVQKSLIGIICILNRRGKFTEFDSYLASIIAYQTGIILTNARLMEEGKKRVKQINLINETARQINSSLVLDDILEYAVSAAVGTLRMNEVGIYLPVENDPNILQIRACSGPLHKQVREQGYIQSVEKGLIGHSFRKGETIYTNDCSRHPLFVAHPLLPTKSEACIPVRREGKVLAVLNVESPDLNAFAESDILVLEILADHMAVAFYNAIAYEKERKHNDQMLLLSELISDLALILDRETIIRTTVEKIKQRFKYYFVAIGMVDHELQVIKDWELLPHFEEIIQSENPAIPFTRGLTGKAVRTGKNILVNDTSKSSEYLDVLRDVNSEMVMPIRIGDEIVAVLDLQSDRVGAFDESDQLIMETLAHALGSALQNADLYARLERSNTQLAETIRMKDEIVQIVAHDFRSPLTVIRGYVDFLLKKGEWKDERQKEVMETVALQAQRLQRLAEATLKASRLDSGDIAFSYEKLDFSSFLQRLIFPWSEKHKFVTNLDQDLPLIKADGGRLQEILENLLSNAIKYSPDGGTIEVTARRMTADQLPGELEMGEINPGEEFLQICISDEGIGIPADKRDLLFKRFSRVHDDRRTEGIGLGLYIAKTMIEKHGGRIWLEDRVKGSRFCLVIPAYEEKPASENILLIDDDVHTLRLLHKAISEMGYDVITAADGREALDKLLRFKPQLIILDVIMPLMSGVELIERLKRNPETDSIPVIVFTGKSDFRLPKQYETINVISKNAGIGALKNCVKDTLATRNHR
jgi:signal transduction histidine kinase